MPAALNAETRSARSECAPLARDTKAAVAAGRHHWRPCWPCPPPFHASMDADGPCPAMPGIAAASVGHETHTNQHENEASSIFVYRAAGALRVTAPSELSALSAAGNQPRLCQPLRTPRTLREPFRWPCQSLPIYAYGQNLLPPSSSISPCWIDYDVSSSNPIGVTP